MPLSSITIRSLPLPAPSRTRCSKPFMGEGYGEGNADV